MDWLEELRKQIDALKLKAYQKHIRSQKVAEFGDIGVKEYCKHCQVSPTGSRSCAILRKLYCRSEMCHFYSKE